MQSMIARKRGPHERLRQRQGSTFQIRRFHYRRRSPMKPIDLKDAKSMPRMCDLSPEEKAALIAQYKKDFDPVQAECEYLELMQNGGIDADEMLRELEEIHQRAKNTP